MCIWQFDKKQNKSCNATPLFKDPVHQNRFSISSRKLGRNKESSFRLHQLFFYHCKQSGIKVLYSTHSKDKMPKIWNKYSQERNIGASVPIFTFMCLWANYIFPRWVCLFCWRKYVDRSWEYINRSQTHECGNWGWGRAIPIKGNYKRNCRCSAVHSHFQGRRLEQLQGERPLQSTSPAGQAKVFPRTVQGYTFSFVYLYWMYSVLVILRRLNFTQVETGLLNRVPPSSHMSYLFRLIYPGLFSHSAVRIL